MKSQTRFTIAVVSGVIAGVALYLRAGAPSEVLALKFVTSDLGLYHWQADVSGSDSVGRCLLPKPDWV